MTTPFDEKDVRDLAHHMADKYVLVAGVDGMRVGFMRAAYVVVGLEERRHGPKWSAMFWSQWDSTLADRMNKI